MNYLRTGSKIDLSMLLKRNEGRLEQRGCEIALDRGRYILMINANSTSL